MNGPERIHRHSGSLNYLVCCAVLSRSVVSDSLRPHGLEPTRLLCPWNSPGRNTGVGSHSLLQRIFPPQGSNPGLLHCRWMLNFLSHQGSPTVLKTWFVSFPSKYKHPSTNKGHISGEWIRLRSRDECGPGSWQDLSSRHQVERLPA